MVMPFQKVSFILKHNVLEGYLTTNVSLGVTILPSLMV
jgi:hypothetical protein